MWRGWLVIGLLCTGCFAYAGERGEEFFAVAPERTPDYTATGVNADLSLYLESYGPDGGSVYCLLRIRIKEACSFCDASLERPIFTIRDEYGDVVPFTRFGVGCYDHRARIRQNGQWLFLDDYEKVVKPSGTEDGEKPRMVVPSASYRNRTFVLAPGGEVVCRLNLSRLYDLSVHGRYVATADWSFVTDLTKKGGDEKYLLENIVILVEPSVDFFRVFPGAAKMEQKLVLPVK